jgi:hypothetical protein
VATLAKQVEAAETRLDALAARATPARPRSAAKKPR